MLVKASAPGSLMLLGEYAVMHGKHALVCAVNKRMTVILEPRPDNKIEITSPRLGHYATDLQHLDVVEPFRFVLTTLKRYRKHLRAGFNLSITSEFSEKIGFASSAAVTVATLRALTHWLEIELMPLALIREARAIVREVQGLGSGADVAACVLGGMVAYKMQPLLAEKISHQHPITAVYAGYKTPTVEAVKQVKQTFTAQPKIVKQLFQAIDACVLQGIQAVRDQDWESMGKIMNIQQGLMESLGVNTPLLSEMIDKLRHQSTMLGAKISGSGLGDCVVGLGQAADMQFSNEQVKLIPVEMTAHGVTCEKI